MLTTSVRVVRSFARPPPLCTFAPEAGQALNPSRRRSCGNVSCAGGGSIRHVVPQLCAAARLHASSGIQVGPYS